MIGPRRAQWARHPRKLHPRSVVLVRIGGIPEIVPVVLPKCEGGGGDTVREEGEERGQRFWFSARQIRNANEMRNDGEKNTGTRPRDATARGENTAEVRLKERKESGARTNETPCPNRAVRSEFRGGAGLSRTMNQTAFGRDRIKNVRTRANNESPAYWKNYLDFIGEKIATHPRL